VDDTHTNREILLRAPQFANTFRTRDAITLELRYNSDEVIVFQNNYDLRVFSQENGKWREIGEEPTQRFPSGEIVLTPTGAMPAVFDVILWAAVEDYDKPYALRIYVLGSMRSEESSEPVAAYVDVNLHP
jgi:hypothetical protein